jgi:hypothetical protein
LRALLKQPTEKEDCDATQADYERGFDTDFVGASEIAGDTHGSD